MGLPGDLSTGTISVDFTAGRHLTLGSADAAVAQQAIVASLDGTLARVSSTEHDMAVGCLLSSNGYTVAEIALLLKTHMQQIQPQLLRTMPTSRRGGHSGSRSSASPGGAGCAYGAMDRQSDLL